MGQDAQLFVCTPDAWLWLPRWARLFLGWTTATFFAACFYLVPLAFLGLPVVWFYHRWAAVALGVGLGVLAAPISFQERPGIRTFFQLWYEPFRFRCNLDLDTRRTLMGMAGRRYILAMHPHGVIPLHAPLFAAYCHQYLRDPVECPQGLYGFGAVATIVGYLPILRQIMCWLTAGDANYATLKAGLLTGKSPSANAAGRHPCSLYLLPGGIAEIFHSRPGQDAIVFKGRRGLVRLALETGAWLLPVYVFGATSLFSNLITGHNVVSRLCRTLRLGATLYWGQFGLPIPYHVPISMIVGEPIRVEQCENPTPEMIETVHQLYIDTMKVLFEKYKVEAGFPEAELLVM